nr:hypothetical protein [Tanacetum cinerariifolium]
PDGMAFVEQQLPADFGVVLGQALQVFALSCSAGPLHIVAVVVVAEDRENR